MCSICGMGFLRGNTLSNKDKEALFDLVSTLLINCQSRGTDATGIAITSRDHIHVIKDGVPAIEFVESDSFKKAMVEKLNIDTNNENRTFSIIGHCRAQTKGSSTNNLNNHPIVAENIVGVHNGMISNDDQLFEMLKGDIKRAGQVDSEIIFRLINYGMTVEKKKGTGVVPLMTKQLKGSFACSFINAMAPHNLWIFRRSSPCDILLYPKVGVVFFASISTFITSAVKKYTYLLGKEKYLPFGYDSGIVINLSNNKSHSFTIPFDVLNNTMMAGFC